MLVIGGLVVGVVVAVSARRDTPHRRIGVSDLVWPASVLGTMAIWIVSVYAWNITKFGMVETDAVGLTTLLWPLMTILASASLAVARIATMRIRSAVLALVGACLGVLLLDIGLGLIGALRDGAVSGVGLVIGALAVLQVGLLGGWLLWARRTTRM
jgi:hypothetical protein